METRAPVVCWVYRIDTPLKLVQANFFIPRAKRSGKQVWSMCHADAAIFGRCASEIWSVGAGKERFEQLRLELKHPTVTRNLASGFLPSSQSLNAQWRCELYRSGSWRTQGQFRRTYAFRQSF
jgi:hypothetical protein